MKILDSMAKRLGYSKTSAAPVITGQQIEQIRRDIEEANYRNRALREMAAGQKRFYGQARSYSGAGQSRLTADWFGGNTSSDAELRPNVIKTLRNRSRDAERNEDYMRRFLSLRDNNVLGSHGVDLRVMAVGAGGKPDKKAGKIVENGWYKWGRKEFCTVSRRLTWNQVGSLSLRGEGRDGGSIVRKVKPFDNAWGYALQPLEIDHLAIDLNTLTGAVPPGLKRTKNEIRNGIELDDWGATAAFWLYPQHPGDYSGVVPTAMAVRIPANECLHIFRPERFSATISAPPVVSALFTMKMLRAYQDAEITAAREAACKGYGIKQATPNSYNGPEEDELGRQLQPVEPGMGLLLNPGEEYFGIDPNHPVDAFPEFCKSIIRSFAAGMGVSYNSLANDLEGVNFSSIRAGLLEEREEWKATQEWFIAELHEPIFEDWLAWSLMNDLLAPLTIADFERVNHAVWTPRRWPWVDPEKDVNAAIKTIGTRLDSRENVIAQTGKSREEIDAQFEADPVTKNIDTKSNYAPNAQPEPQEVPITNGNGNGSGRLTFNGH